MIYTEMTNKAMRICFDAHKDQVDKSGLPYVFHPFHLAEQMETEETVTVALLHEVVEDSSYTLEALEQEGFPPKILEAVHLMTHQDGVPYMEYVQALAQNPIARKVKLADLTHNSDPSRLAVVDEFAKRRMERYSEAMAYLKALEHNQQ